MLEPDLQLSRKVYESMDWVALTEFFHESKCLFYFRLQPKSTHVQDYIHNTCHCQQQQPPEFKNNHADNNNHQGTIVSTMDADNTTTTTDDVHITHHDHAGRGSTMLDLPLDIVTAVDALTRVDQALYTWALEQFMREMVWLETRLGRRVLCDAVLEQWEPELAYLNVSVTTLYKNEKQQQQNAENEDNVVVVTT